MTLRETRFLKGLNQYDLSLRTGISQSKISLMENGYVVPREDEKKKIAKVLRCKVEDIFPNDERR